ncbi:MAG: Gx transporter family protein [Pseudomonadota bacterium]|nr:Gx transporter family protein [Gammaproteobacteria bacterium]MBU1731707.1 Gx transporter family protein [Gammaproteobacteria bacterium]MBU1892531.1 Gx transporter family protein [Gammaproteobacteria bacterium]
MTRSVINLPASPDDHRLARLAAFAIGLSLAEAALPSPLPGVKPGLANIITLLVLQRFGWRAAAWVTLLRVVAGSLLLGTFLSPGFFLSFSGALISLIALGVACRLPSSVFGPVTHSIMAAFAHIAAQLCVVYFWLIPHAGVLYLAPVFAAAALFFGIINGMVTARLLDNPLHEPQPVRT